MGLCLTSDKSYRLVKLWYRLLFVFSFLLLLTAIGTAQKRQLTPSSKVVKIALVDHSRLRKEYREFAAARDKWAQESAAQRKSFEQSLQTLEQQTAEQLRLDSLSGGKDREQILSQAAAKRSELTGLFQAAQKKRYGERMTLAQRYERKITLALDSIVAEGGFTQAQPLSKEASSIKGRDITDLILQKLN